MGCFDEKNDVFIHLIEKHNIIRTSIEYYMVAKNLLHLNEYCAGHFMLADTCSRIMCIDT